MYTPTLFPASILLGGRSFLPVYITVLGGYALSCQLLSGRQECRGSYTLSCLGGKSAGYTLFLSSQIRESIRVGVHSFLRVSKLGGKSAQITHIHKYTCTQYAHTLQSVMWFKGDKSQQLD